jgi:hypothetical protein
MNNITGGLTPMVSTLSQASSKLGSTDGFVEATSESTSKCITDGGGVNFPHNSCNSGMINIIGALTPMVSSPSQENNMWGCGNGEGLARGRNCHRGCFLQPQLNQQ